MADEPAFDDGIVSRRRFALVEAFLDGERVDPIALKDVLADAEAREHLVDVLLIREAIGVIEPRASAAPSPSLAGRRSRARWLAAAAAMALVSLTVGYAAGQRVAAPSAVPSTVEAVLPMDAPASAPSPTRSIAFTPGVNWTDSPAGR